MSRTPFDPQPSELLRRLAAEHVPAAPEEGSAARRDRFVRVLKGAVERSAAQAERRRRFLRIGYGLAAAAAFALLGGVAMKARTAPAPPPPALASIAGIERVSGTVVLTQDGAGHVVGAGELALRDGDAVETAAGARARVATTKAAIEIAESTVVELSRPSAAEERISLRRGRVDVAVDKGVHTQRAVVVQTPDVEVVVRGTVFDVRVESERGVTKTHVHVSKGSVWVLAQGTQVALLTAGQSWSSAGGGDTRAGSVPVGASEATSAAAPSSVPAPAAAVPSVAPRVARAPKSAASASKEARKPGTLSDENRLFAAGVDARNRGDAARAAELFGELLTAFPQSTLREAAQVERFRALDRAGQKARAASEARRYLAEHRDGFAKSEARDLALDAPK